MFSKEKGIHGNRWDIFKEKWVLGKRLDVFKREGDPWEQIGSYLNVVKRREVKGTDWTL